MVSRKHTTIKRKVKNWTAADSAELYCIDAWSNGYFGVSRNGEVTVNLVDTDGEKRPVSLHTIMKGLAERGTDAPVLLRYAAPACGDGRGEMFCGCTGSFRGHRQ